MSILHGVGRKLVVGMAVAGLWLPFPASGQDAARLTLVPATQMAELAANQKRITRLVGEARDEIAVAPLARVANGGLRPILTNLEAATARSRSLSEGFDAVAVADGLSVPSAAFCAKVAGVSVAEDDRVAVALARHHVEVMTQAMDRFRLEPAHGAVETQIAGLGGAASAGSKVAETREALMLARRRLAEALDLYSREVLLPFADAVMKARGSVADPAEAERDCASSVPAPAGPAPPASAEALTTSDLELRREASSAVLRGALDAVAAATTPPADIERIPRFIGDIVHLPRKIKAVEPRYTARAIAACIEGQVILETVITKAGKVRAVSVLKPLPGLTVAAVEAVRRWQFEPATLNDRPVEVYYTLTINFRAPAECAGRTRRPRDPWQ